MNGLNTHIIYDVAQRQNAETIAKAQRNQLVREAMRLNGHVGPATTIRRIFGATVINIGEWIHGDRPAGEAGIESAAGTLGVAR